MKGYGILAMVVSIVLLSFPPLMLSGDDRQRSAETSEFQSVTVHHTDEDASSEMALMDMTVYETAAQISWDAPIEAIKAQALACYTLLYYQMLTADIVENTCLPYPTSYTETYWKTTLGEHFEEAMTIYRSAVQSVYGKLIVCDSKPIMALSHTMNGGVTENGHVLIGEELPYLQSVASPADATATEQLKTMTFTIADTKERLTALLETAPTGEATTWFGACQKTSAGTVETVAVCGQTISGRRLQEVFALSSAAFDVAVQGEQIVFTVHGNGHFVGLSTYGAIAMAMDGHTFDEILDHYYTDVAIA